MKKIIPAILTILLCCMLFLCISLATPESALEHKDINQKETNSTQPELTVLPVYIPMPIKTVHTEEPIIENAFKKEPVIDRQIFDKTNRETREALDAYKMVLRDNLNFSDPLETGKYMNTNLCRLTDDFVINGQLKEFGIIDLDQDGLPEVILVFGTYQDYFVILHYQHNLVYAYSLGNRSFNTLKIDGSFGFSSSGFESGTGTISFNVYSIITHELNYHLDDYYIIDHQRTTEEEYRKAQDFQDSKPNVTWYEFTEDNIETYLSY
ncbi:MAG: hypothetical protein HFI75_04790 [Lachnospiraceae bacterium]|nr:hypothetical protein [Lachnospiraceae bacterium]